MVDAHCVRDEGVSPYIVVAFHWVRVRVRLGYTKFQEYVNHMPEAFTQAFVAVIFFHRSYRGSYHGFVFESFRGRKLSIIADLIFAATKASVKASAESFRESSVEANLLPRKFP